MLGENQAGDFAQAAFGAVAGHGVADFFRTGEADVDGWVIIVAITGLEEEGFGALAAFVVAGEVLRAHLHDLQIAVI